MKRMKINLEIMRNRVAVNVIQVHVVSGAKNGKV